jgi:hypothetical protein
MQTKPITVTYISALSDTPSLFRDSLKRVPFTRSDAPDQIYGVGVRVGATGRTDYDRALYRLKLKICFAPSQTTATLPGFFVLENGAFVVYDDGLTAQA